MGVNMRADMATVKEREIDVKLLDLGRQVAEVKEAERLRMAEHLHDEFGQSLLVAKMRLGMLSDELPAQYVGSVNGVTEIISDLIRRTRASIEDLYSSSHCPAGLRAGLVSLARDLETKHELVCSTKLDSMPDQWRDEAKQLLYRAVRELLCNVTKHARATQVKISAFRKQSFFIIEVKDNGRGFSRDQAHVPSVTHGFGLWSVRADLATIGAELHIFSRIGKGTKATVVMPLSQS
jgi:signal transduction histidine kinase